MILAGTRPPEYAAALRAERARRAAEAELDEAVEHDEAAEHDEAVVEFPREPGAERSAVEIAPRPPSD